MINQLPAKVSSVTTVSSKLSQKTEQPHAMLVPVNAFNHAARNTIRHISESIKHAGMVQRLIFLFAQFFFGEPLISTLHIHIVEFQCLTPIPALQAFLKL